MAPTILNSTIILRKMLEILHNKVVFASTVDRQYDSAFKGSGLSGKPGTSLSVRKPVQHVVRSGRVLDVQDTVEESVTINCATQKGIDLQFTSEDLTMKIDDFAERYLETAAARLAAEIDKDGFQLYKDVYNSVGTAGTSPNTAEMLLQAGQKLSENLSNDDKRMLCIDPRSNTSLVNALDSAFNPVSDISKLYRKGMMGSAYGFDFMQSAQIPNHTTGTREATTDTVKTTISVEGTSQVVLTVDSGRTMTKGDIFTMAGVYAVNPETKSTYQHLQQFVCTANAAAVGTDLTVSISPEIRTTGARQTVDAFPQATAAVVVVGDPSKVYPQNLAYDKKAFTLVTADLQVPNGVDFARRETYEGISMRVIRDYDVNNDNFPCRFDVYYGWTTLRPEWACRITG